MKKFLAILLSLIISITMLTALTGCDEGYTPDGKKIVKVYAPAQTPAVTILKLLFENEQIDEDKYQVEYELVNGQEINGIIGMKTPDVVIAPTNFIAEHYVAEGNAKSEYQIAAATSFGAFYLLTTDGTDSFDDLEGKTLICQGGAVGASAMVLKYLLAEKGYQTADDTEAKYVHVLYEADAALIRADLADPENPATIGLFPEPALTSIKTALGMSLPADSLKTVDLQEVWEEAEGDYGYPIACLAFKKSFLEEFGDFCSEFARKVKESVEWVTNDTSAVREDVIEALNELKTRDSGILDTGVTEGVFTNAIGRFNIGFKLTGESGTEAWIRKYLTTIAPSVVIPADSDMFYKGITF